MFSTTFGIHSFILSRHWPKVMATNLFIDHGQPHFDDFWHNSWLLDETSALELKLCRCKVGQLQLKGVLQDLM